MFNRRTLRTAEASAILLFWVHGLIVLFSRLFGVIYDTVFASTLGPIELGLVTVGVVLAFLAPLLLPRDRDRSVLLASSVAAAFARVLLTVDAPSVRLWMALLLTGTGSAYAVTLLRRRASTFATGLVVALIAAQLMRVAGYTYDISLRRAWLPVQVVISSAVCVAAWQLSSRPLTERPIKKDNGIGILNGLSLGAFLFVETSLLGFPNTLARWTGASYTLTAPLLMAATVLPFLRSGEWSGFVLFVITLAAGYLTDHQFYQLALLAPMLLAQLAFVSSIRKRVATTSSTPTRFTFCAGMGLFLVLNVALAFAFTYPYTIPYFRDKGDYVFLLSIVTLLVPITGRAPPAFRRQVGSARALSWGSAVAATVLTTALALPSRSSRPYVGGESVRAATYNIHYGFDSNWRYSLEDQARTIEESGADIVFLQEVDAGRITSYGVDDALWLGHRLRMEQVFGPALEDLSGVAVLSRLPVTEGNSYQLTSELEQTAIVHARLRLRASQLSASGEASEEALVLDAFGTWLGLEPDERARQLQDALDIIGDAAPAVLGGDFNAPPLSPTYTNIQEAGFRDAYYAVGAAAPPTSPAIDPTNRIDFVWARGLTVRDADVLDSLASDHRLVVAEFDLP